MTTREDCLVIVVVVVVVVVVVLARVNTLLYVDVVIINTQNTIQDTTTSQHALPYPILHHTTTQQHNIGYDTVYDTHW